MNSLKKIFFVLFKPKKVFEGLKEKPLFAAPLLILLTSMMIPVILGTVVPVLYAPDMGIPGKMSEAQIKQAKQEMKKYGLSEADIKKAEKELREGLKPATDAEIAQAQTEMRKAGLSETEIAKNTEMMKNPEKTMKDALKNKPSVVTLVTTTFFLQVLPVLIAFLLSIAFFNILAFGFNLEKGFLISASLVSFAWMPLVIRYIIQTVKVLINKIPVMETGLTDVFHIAPFSMTDMSGMPDISLQYILYTFLQRIDLFSLWAIILMIVGLAILFKLSYKKAVPIVLGYFALSTIVAAITGIYGPQLQGLIMGFLPFLNS